MFFGHVTDDRQPRAAASLPLRSPAFAFQRHADGGHHEQDAADHADAAVDVRQHVGGARANAPVFVTR